MGKKRVKVYMNIKKDVSIVLGSYNRFSILPLVITSVCKEIKNLSSEIIVIDGGSNDGSLQWLLQQKDIITIIQHNRGKCQGKDIKRKSWGYFMNLGFKCAQGKYICMISDDALLIPGAIKNGINYAEEQLKKGISLGGIAFYYRDWGRENEYHVGCSLGNKMYINHGLYLNKALKDVEYIDEDTYSFYNADGDICLKMWQKGYTIIDSANSFVEHYPHANVEIRKTNHATQKQDNLNYFKKWQDIFYDPLQHNIGKRITKKFEDKTKTGELFKNIHKKTLEKHPKLFQKTTKLQQIKKSFLWKFDVIKRKIKRIFFL
jgi:glycosyltransferase involved in cell wall biosynthesis